MKVSHAVAPTDADYPDDTGAERAALTRLRIASNLSGGTPVRELNTDSRSEVSGWWFMLRLWRWHTKVVDAVLSVRGSGSGAFAAIEQFMQRANADVARFSVVRTTSGVSDFAAQAQGRRRLWFFQANREYRDLLSLVGGTELFLARLGSHTRRNIRRSARIAAAEGLRFAFVEQAGAIVIDDAVFGLAAQNRPAPASPANIAVFEQMLAHRPTSFTARITTTDGALVSLCRGFVTGRTAYLVYQINSPLIPRINIGLLQTFSVIQELCARGVSEVILVMGGNGLLKAACQVSSKEELITIRPSLRGLATTAFLAVALKGTRFGDALWCVLGAIVRHWVWLPKATYDHAVHMIAPPGTPWPRAIAGCVGVTVSVVAVGAGVLIRSGVEFIPYITAYPAILIATYLAGAWTGFVTVTIGGLGILYFVVPPYDSFALERGRDVVATGVYLISALPLWRWLSRRAKLMKTT